MSKVIGSWKMCAYSKPYLLDVQKRKCGHPSGSPWCSIHPGDLVEGFPFNCPLRDAE